MANLKRQLSNPGDSDDSRAVLDNRELRAMGKVTHRWTRIAARLVDAENSRDRLWEEVQESRRIIAEQREIIEYHIPSQETKYAWLYWSLRRKEIKAVIADAPSDKAERRAEQNRIRCAMVMRLPMHIYVREGERNGKFYFKIIKGRPWGSLINQTRENEHEEGTENKAEPNDQ